MADLQESLERNEELKIMRIHTKYFFTSVKMKTQKNDQNYPIFAKIEAYASFTDGLRLFYDSLLISQMLKFKQ